jgi:hypothetical protein
MRNLPQIKCVMEERRNFCSGTELKTCTSVEDGIYLRLQQRRCELKRGRHYFKLALDWPKRGEEYFQFALISSREAGVRSSYARISSRKSGLSSSKTRISPGKAGISSTGEKFSSKDVGFRPRKG